MSIAPLFPEVLETTESDLSEAEMQIRTEDLPFGGGYLGKTEACAVANNHNPLVQGLQVPLPTAVIARMEEGNDFESRVGASFRTALSSPEYVFLDYSHDDLDEVTRLAWEADTMSAMADGALFIWNARLPRNAQTRRTGEPDFLVRAGDERNAQGKWAYRPGDVKHHKVLESAKTVRSFALSSYADPRLEGASVTDVLGGGKPKLSDGQQLGHYVDMLEDLGHNVDPGQTRYGAILGKEELIVWFDLDERNYRFLDRATGQKRLMSPIEIQRQEFAHRMSVIRRELARVIDPSLDPLVGPEHKSACTECVWRTLCHDEMLSLPGVHITLLNGITPERAQVHYQMGISTIAQLAALDWRTATLVDAGMDVEDMIDSARMLEATKAASFGDQAQRELMRKLDIVTYGDVAQLDRATARYSGMGAWHLAESIDQARVYLAERVHRKRGVGHVALAQVAVEWDVDMENGSDGLIYLWGVKETIRRNGTVTQRYIPFCDFSGTEEGEATAFANFWTQLQATRTKVREQHQGGFRAFCYSGAENRCMRALARRHAGVLGVPSLDEVEEFIASDDWVDLLEVLDRNLIWPTETMGLKDVAKYVKFAWRDEDANGGSSVTWYDDALHAVLLEDREAAVARILDYNEDDVTATYVLREWLRRLGEARRPGQKLPGVEALEGRYRRPRRNPVITQVTRRERKVL